MVDRQVLILREGGGGESKMFLCIGKQKEDVKLSHMDDIHICQVTQVRVHQCFALDGFRPNIQ